MEDKNFFKDLTSEQAVELVKNCSFKELEKIFEEIDERTQYELIGKTINAGQFINIIHYMRDASAEKLALFPGLLVVMSHRTF